jgi:micrococcal nuclease
MSSRRFRRQLMSLVLALLAIGLSYYANRYPAQTSQVIPDIPTGSYQVVEFADGDTISVDMNGQTERVRMIGVDTPETHDPRKAVECFGQAASEFTRKLIGSGPVRLEADSLSTNRDRYDRLLRHVYTADNKLVSAEIIKQGYGFAYLSFPFSKLDEFRQYEKEAEAAGRGLWSGCQPYLDKDGYIHSNPA